jgi:predicted DNA-binding transcriptional regulator AlpA
MKLDSPNELTKRHLPSKSSAVRDVRLRYLSQKDVAQMLGMSEAWLERKRCEGGGIPFKRFGTSVRYLEADVLAWIANQPTQTNAAMRLPHR